MCQRKETPAKRRTLLRRLMPSIDIKGCPNDSNVVVQMK